MRGVLLAMVVGGRTAFDEMRSQPLRSALSVAGVALAVASLVALLSLLSGLDAYTRAVVQEMGGPGRLMILPQPPEGLEQARAHGRSRGLHRSDMERIDAAFPERIDALPTLGDWFEGRAGAWEGRMWLQGVQSGFLENQVRAQLVWGRFPTAEEFARGDAVAVVGWNLDEALGREALARGTRISDIPLHSAGIRWKVIGAFDVGRSRFWRQGVTAYVPLRASERFVFSWSDTIDNLQAQFLRPESAHVLSAVLVDSLKAWHRGAENFRIQLFEWVDIFEGMIAGIRALFLLVAGVSLAVGAFGILNVMLASLQERVREVGIRKSQGATPVQIAVQFLMESMTLAAVGGLVGLAAGSFPVWFSGPIREATGIAPALDIGSSLLAMTVAVFTGFLAGLVPARQAMRLPPMVAMDHE